MATALKVSRGSFYWHFRDFADYRSQLLETWRERSVDRVIQEFDRDPDQPDRLRRLIERAFFGKRGLDRAMRMWAAQDSAVAATVAEVDGRRIAYMTELLTAAGVEPDQAQSRAAFIYWAYLGQTLVMDPAHAALNEAAIAAIVDRLAV